MRECVLVATYFPIYLTSCTLYISTYTYPATPGLSFLALLEFILEDLKERFDLASAWLFAEYSISEDYLRGTPNHHHHQYDACLTGLLNGAKEKLEPRDRYMCTCISHDFCVYTRHTCMFTVLHHKDY